MTNIQTLAKDEREYAQQIWDAFHTPGAPATGLAQALLVAARHYHGLNKAEDFRKRAKAQAEIARINAIGEILYGVAVADLAKVSFGPSKVAEVRQPLSSIREMGKRDAQNGQVKFETETDDEAVKVAAGSAYLSGLGEFEKSRWAVVERHYWEGVGRVLASQYVAKAGLKEDLDQNLGAKEEEWGPEELATRCRLGALKALNQKGADKTTCSRIYESFIADEKLEEIANKAVLAGVQSLQAPSVSRGRSQATSQSQ